MNGCLWAGQGSAAAAAAAAARDAAACERLPTRVWSLEMLMTEPRGGPSSEDALEEPWGRGAGLGIRWVMISALLLVCFNIGRVSSLIFLVGK